MKNSVQSILADGRTSLNQYFCNSRLRIDTWNQLKENVALLHASMTDGQVDSEKCSRVLENIRLLEPIERYWAFPGHEAFQNLIIAFESQHWSVLEQIVTIIARLISTDHYRSHDWMPIWKKLLLQGESESNEFNVDIQGSIPLQEESRPYFEVLVVDSLAVDPEHQLRHHQIKLRRSDDNFIYNVIVVSNFEDAVIATLLNYNIQACVVRYTFPFHSDNQLRPLTDTFLQLAGLSPEDLETMPGNDRSGALAKMLRLIRPELDLYLFSESSVEKVSTELHHQFRRCFFGSEDYAEMHMTLLKGIEQRFETPFFNALKKYAQQPTGVFHAMPISRSKSISKSHWIGDYGHFYGDRMFLSETSATTGGLDSLLQPHGSIKRSQTLAARAFAADKTLFVSNGTSTANKIVLQAIAGPGDIVLFSNDCHQSHHFASVLSDIRPAYINAFPLPEYGISGAVPLRDIKRCLLEFKQAGKLERVRALSLTNLTFDGIAYDVERFMTECLAIKPDLIFLWDEAWFAYGYFTPLTRKRSAMHVANRLKRRFASPSYRKEYKVCHHASPNQNQKTNGTCPDKYLLPDPDKVKVRVYATQSTHKTLTALRQAAMIHINDEEFTRDIASRMRDAYLTHTSTSPNYQILASLDIARRQMEFEGYELIQKAFELSMILRDQIASQTPLCKYFRALGPADLIPAPFKSSSQQQFRNHQQDWTPTENAWQQDEFAIDPTRITLDISHTGMDGNCFRDMLMNRFDVQVNKTSCNTVLFIIHIGSTRGMITYLIESLTKIAQELDHMANIASEIQLKHQQQRITELSSNSEPIPAFTGFHKHFRDGSSTCEGNLRKAYYAAQRPGVVEFIPLSETSAREVEQGRGLVSAGFITPYPPGYPILVPGQLICAETIRFIIKSDSSDIHGLDREIGLPVFIPSALTTETE